MSAMNALPSAVHMSVALRCRSLAPAMTILLLCREQDRHLGRFWTLLQIYRWWRPCSS